MLEMENEKKLLLQNQNTQNVSNMYIKNSFYIENVEEDREKEKRKNNSTETMSNNIEIINDEKNNVNIQEKFINDNNLSKFFFFYCFIIH